MSILLAVIRISFIYEFCIKLNMFVLSRGLKCTLLYLIAYNGLRHALILSLQLYSVCVYALSCFICFIDNVCLDHLIYVDDICILLLTLLI